MKKKKRVEEGWVLFFWREMKKKKRGSGGFEV